MTTKEYNLAVNNYSDGIYRFAIKHLKNEMAAKDIVQETYVKVWEKHDEIAFNKAKSYLFTTAYHKIIDYIKKDKRFNSEVDTQKPSNDYNEHDAFDLKAILNKAVETLPDIQKSVLLLRDYEGYSYQEIAEITNLNESQVKVYIFRARKALQVYLKDINLYV